MFKKILKITLKSILSIIIIFALMILLINLIKHPLYSKYYRISEDLNYVPGLGQGFVPQGVSKTKINDEDYYLTSGYMSNDKPSRIYISNDKDTYYVNVLVDDNTLAYDHFGGISISKDKVYLTGERTIYELRLEDFFTIKTTKNPTEVQQSVKVQNSYNLDIETSFIFVDSNDTYLYVGEFNHGPYQPNHPTVVNDGDDTYYAYLKQYQISNLDISKECQEAVKTYAIRDKVQGFATDGNKFVLSTSYGLASSTIYTYNIPTVPNEDNIYLLDDDYLIESIKAPAMLEALDYCSETRQFITLFESASNKYFFGKLFLANKIIGFEI